MLAKKEAPEGYMKDPQGRLVPIDIIKDIDIERDALVRKVIQEAEVVANQTKKFREKVETIMEKFIQKSFKQHGVKVGGRRGGITLTTYDGEFKIIKSVDDKIEFNEKLQAARELIRACIKDWSSNSKPELVILINDAFSVDKKGKLNKERILSLRRYNINDKRWKKAMQAIDDAIQVVDTREYTRIYKRDEDGIYRYINLNAL